MIKIFPFVILMFISLATHSQQHSDVYLAVDSIFKNELHFNGKIDIDEPYIRKGWIIPSVPDSSVFKNSINCPGTPGLKWIPPMILLVTADDTIYSFTKNQPCFLDELDGINSSDIDSITLMKRSMGSAIYGPGACNGLVYISAKKDISQKLKSFNCQDISFVADSVEVSIDRSVPEKFLWKQLILNDPYFCHKLLPATSRKGLIHIAACKKIASSSSNHKEYEMRIYVRSVKTNDQIADWPGILSEDARPPRKFIVTLNEYRSFVYDIRTEGGVDF